MCLALMCVLVVCVCVCVRAACLSHWTGLPNSVLQCSHLLLSRKVDGLTELQWSLQLPYAHIKGKFRLSDWPTPEAWIKTHNPIRSREHTSKHKYLHARLNGMASLESMVLVVFFVTLSAKWLAWYAWWRGVPFLCTCVFPCAQYWCGVGFRAWQDVKGHACWPEAQSQIFSDNSKKNQKKNHQQQWKNSFLSIYIGLRFNWMEKKWKKTKAVS